MIEVDIESPNEFLACVTACLFAALLVLLVVDRLWKFCKRFFRGKRRRPAARRMEAVEESIRRQRPRESLHHSTPLPLKVTCTNCGTRFAVTRPAEGEDSWRMRCPGCDEVVRLNCSKLT